MGCVCIYGCLYYKTDLVLLLGENPIVNQRLCILGQDCRLFCDLLVHERLCEHWLINLIVAEPTVTHLYV